MQHMTHYTVLNNLVFKKTKVFPVSLEFLFSQFKNKTKQNQSAPECLSAVKGLISLRLFIGMQITVLSKKSSSPFEQVYPLTSCCFVTQVDLELLVLLLLPQQCGVTGVCPRHALPGLCSAGDESRAPCMVLCVPQVLSSSDVSLVQLAFFFFFFNIASILKVVLLYIQNENSLAFKDQNDSLGIKSVKYIEVKILFILEREGLLQPKLFWN